MAQQGQVFKLKGKGRIVRPRPLVVHQWSGQVKKAVFAGIFDGRTWDRTNAATRPRSLTLAWFLYFAGVLLAMPETPLTHSTTLRGRAGGQTVVTAQHAFPTDKLRFA